MKDLTNKRIERRKYNSTLEKEGKISGTQEFFTPEKLCNEMLDKIPAEAYKNLDTTFWTQLWVMEIFWSLYMIVN